jgi:hypothetical protein
VERENRKKFPSRLVEEKMRKEKKIKLYQKDLNKAM